MLGTILVSSHLQELLYRARNYLSLLTFTVCLHLQKLLYRARIYLSLFTFTGAVKSC